VAEFLERRDEASFLALYREHAPAMYRFARSLTGSEADAEDAVQAAWIAAVRKLSSFRWESSLRTWLSGIVRYACRELRRSAPPDVPRTDSGCFTAPERLMAAGTREVEGQARRLDLRAAVAALPPGYREVLILHDVEGFTHEEIAAILGIEAGSSKSQLSRARRALRELLGEAPGVPIEKRGRHA